MQAQADNRHGCAATLFRSLALDAVRKPPPRARREARGRAADRGAVVSRAGLSSRHAERRRRAAEHHQARALQLFSRQGRNPVRMLGARAGARRRASSPRSTPRGGSGLAKLRKLVHAYAEVMATDYGASLVRFDPRDLTEKNRKIVRAAKKSIDRTFRKYIADGIADGSIKPCDPKLAAFAIAGSLNWIGHWYQPDGALSADAIAGRIHGSAHRRAGDKTARDKGGRHRPQRSNDQRGRIRNEHHAWIAARAADQSERPCDRCSATGGGTGARSASAWRGWPPASRALGANPGDRVAILSLNSDRYLELYLATGWAGAVIVPLNIRWSPLENEDAMRDCRASMLIVDKAFASIGRGTGESPSRPEAGLCRRRRRAGRNGKLRGAAGCGASRCRTRCAPAPTSPASSTPAAPPAARRA